MPRPRAVAPVVGAVAAAVLAMTVGVVACSSSGSGSRRDSGSSSARRGTTTSTHQLARAGTTVEVLVRDNIFTPVNLRIRPGVQVRWRNDGFSPHVITASEPNQDFHGAGGVPFGVASEHFREQQLYTFTFTRPGVYDYYCSIHGLPHQAMHARVTVVGP
jgi:plastocyanin